MNNDLYIPAALLLMNVATFAAYGVDKLKARRDKWRIPERTLLWMAFLGGALGAWLGMKAFRHKTQHRRFTVLVPLFLILQIGLAVYLLFSRCA